MRDSYLPSITSEYIHDVLSVKNFATGRGAPISVNGMVLTEAQKKLQEYMDTMNGFHEFYFALGSTALPSTVNVPSQELSETVTQNIRKLFRLRAAQNVPRGALGRLATRYGSLASARDQFESACIAENRSRFAKQQQQLQKQTRRIKA